jgi:hypothetical protein
MVVSLWQGAVMKLCKDCKHYFRGHHLSWFPPSCDSPHVVRSPIHGGSMQSAMEMRIGSCGPEAKYFEPKPEKISLIRRLFRSKA